MSILHHDRGHTHLLATRTTVGSDALCTVPVPDPRVSTPHALLRYDSRSRWVVRDLGSRNGTWLNGAPITAFVDHPLAAGDKLVFGSAEAGTWTIGSTEPPVAFAVHRKTGACVRGTTDTLVVVDGDVRWELARLGDLWELQPGDDERPAWSGMPLGADNAWTVYLPQHGSTVGVRPFSLRTATLAFVEHDTDEGVSFTLEQDGRTLELGDSALWRLLWVLADERAHSPRPDETERGWISISDLEHRTGLDRKSIDIYVGRLKKELTQRKVLDVSGVVEVRNNWRRIGVPAARIRT
jgi:hypothetical protein